jgi:hypothetical protein
VPKQNRITPFGELVAVPERGTFMGNRGCLHDAHQRVRRAWQLKRWIVCVLAFRGRKRQVMRPGHYTELFFLDEATALAAGHRPCAECRRAAFNAFRQALAPPPSAPVIPSAVELDDQLHTRRLNPDGSRHLHTAQLDPLPDGVFVLAPGDESTPYLVRGDNLLAWSFGGYTRSIARPRGIRVRVLTPGLTVRAIRGGYAPEVHSSALALSTRGEGFAPTGR